MANPRVVVADDHAETRARIVRLLEFEFDVIATAADGQAAVEACGTLHPDVVVLDVTMPVLNGFQAADIIRDLADAPRIVFCTAHDDGEFARAAREVGASALVPKRRMQADLVPAVRRALHFHAVYFYENARSLSLTVAGFIGEGLIAGQAAIVIARSSHRAAIREQLVAMGAGAEKRIAQGDIQVLDAEEVLNGFMVDGLPDARRFEDTMKPIMDRTAGSRKRLIRAYGEMVDLLWMNGQEAAAVSLEVLWNQLIARGKCSLLCGYSSDRVGTGAGLDVICDQHSHVVGESVM
jgi:CheY-like chemotaxis protein